MSYPNFGGGGYPGAPGGGYPGAGGGYPGAGGGYPGGGAGYPAPGGGGGYPGAGGGYPGAGGGYPGAGGGYPGAGGGYPGAGGGYPGAGGAYPPGGGGGYPGSGGGFPITNPPVPYNGPIEGGVQDGKMVFISGFLTPEATNFYVNFRSGSDVAFHFNPRFHGGERPKVVRNAEIRGSWGNEETHGDSPFNRGSSFEIIVAIDSKCYKVSVNGNHYCEFNHRMTKEDVNTLEIGGDLTIQSIRYQGGPSIGGGGGFPGDTGDLCPGPPFPGGPGIGGQPGMGGGWGGAGGGGGFSVPHKEQIPHGGLYPGRMIFISGVPHSGAQGFQVNFTVGDWPDADKAFHFNPRFGENTVVRNTCQAGSWGGEERQQNNFPFQQGVNFDMCIAVEHDKYKVAVNNQHFIEYRHRISDLGAITAVQIEGDIRLTNVRVQ